MSTQLRTIYRCSLESSNTHGFGPALIYAAGDVLDIPEFEREEIGDDERSSQRAFGRWAISLIAVVLCRASYDFFVGSRCADSVAPQIGRHRVPSFGRGKDNGIHEAIVMGSGPFPAQHARIQLQILLKVRGIGPLRCDHGIQLGHPSSRRRKVRSEDTF